MGNTGSKLQNRPPGNGKITCGDKGSAKAGVHCGERAGRHMSSHEMMKPEVIRGSRETTRGILRPSWPHKKDAHTELAAIQRRAIRMIKRPEGVP